MFLIFANGPTIHSFNLYNLETRNHSDTKGASLIPSLTHIIVWVSFHPIYFSSCPLQQHLPRLLPFLSRIFILGTLSVYPYLSTSLLTVSLFHILTHVILNIQNWSISFFSLKSSKYQRKKIIKISLFLNFIWLVFNLAFKIWSDLISTSSALSYILYHSFSSSYSILLFAPFRLHGQISLSYWQHGTDSLSNMKCFSLSSLITLIALESFLQEKVTNLSEWIK